MRNLPIPQKRTAVTGCQEIRRHRARVSLRPGMRGVAAMQHLHVECGNLLRRISSHAKRSPAGGGGHKRAFAPITGTATAATSANKTGCGGEASACVAPKNALRTSRSE